jgi:hypothetical protein
MVFSEPSEKSSFLHRSLRSGSGKGIEFSRTVFSNFLGDIINFFEDRAEIFELNKEEKRSFLSRNDFEQESEVNKGEN